MYITIVIGLPVVSGSYLADQRCKSALLERVALLGGTGRGDERHNVETLASDVGNTGRAG